VVCGGGSCATALAAARAQQWGGDVDESEPNSKALEGSYSQGAGAPS